MNVFLEVGIKCDVLKLTLIHVIGALCIIYFLR